MTTSTVPPTKAQSRLPVTRYMITIVVAVAITRQLIAFKRLRCGLSLVIFMGFLRDTMDGLKGLYYTIILKIVMQDLLDQT